MDVLECKEINKKGEKKTYCWVTNLPVNENNVLELSNEGGRLRWKIENEGFNMQKNGGYNLEHIYSSHPTAIQNYYLLIQIAHIFNQLVEKGSLRQSFARAFPCIKNLSEELVNGLKFFDIDFNSSFFKANKYISFDTS